MNALRSSTLLAVLALTACGPLDPNAPSEDTLGSTARGLGMTEADAALVLALVNYPGTDAATLDDQAGLDHRAATNIITHRDGPDGLALTADDHPFATLVELDAIVYVGDSALASLLKYARKAPAPGPEVVEGVAFTGWQSAAVVWGVNTLSYADLDGVLDARSVTGLVAARPFVSVKQMGPVASVGPSALNALKAMAAAWWTQMHYRTATLAGTFDGVAFDEPTAAKTLALANTASVEQLMLHGVNSGPAAAIAGGRPFTSLGAVSAITGIGAATMASLKAWALAPAVDPLQALKDQLAPLTNNLWFPSETDAQLLFVSSPGIGREPITEALIRAKLGSQHDLLLPQVMYVPTEQVPLWTRTHVEELDAVTYLNRIIDNADPNDPASLATAQRFVQLRDALHSQLTDLKVFRFGEINISVFIVGRTANGDLAGLLTGQVET